MPLKARREWDNKLVTQLMFFHYEKVKGNMLKHYSNGTSLVSPHLYCLVKINGIIYLKLCRIVLKQKSDWKNIKQLNVFRGIESNSLEHLPKSCDWLFQV